MGMLSERGNEMIVLLIAIVSTIGVLVSGIALVALIGKWAVDTGRGRPPCSPSRLDLYTAGCVADELKIGVDLGINVTEEFARLLTAAQQPKQQDGETGAD